MRDGSPGSCACSAEPDAAGHLRAGTDSDYYDPGDERCILWDDAELGINWPIDDIAVSLSEKDKKGSRFAAADLYP